MSNCEIPSLQLPVLSLISVLLTFTPQYSQPVDTLPNTSQALCYSKRWAVYAERAQSRLKTQTYYFLSKQSIAMKQNRENKRKKKETWHSGVKV